MSEDENDTGELDSRLPTTADRTFVDVHPLRGAVIAERTDERLYRMINGFSEAAHLLVEQSEAEPHLRRNFIYPVLFLYRQSLELHLKYLVMAYGPLAGEAPEFRSHDLGTLWLKCKRVIQFFEGNAEPADKEMFQAVESHIAEFNTVDPGSYVFRFAHDTNGHAIKIPMDTIDLPNLRNVLASLHNFLDCVDCQLRYGYDITPCKY